MAGGVLGAVLLATPVLAQDEAAPGRAALQDDFSQAMQAFEAGHTDAAIDLLEAIVEDDPAFVSAGQGAAAYWLGRAYEADEDPESALEVWHEGFDALDAAGRFDPRLTDVFVRQTYARRQADAYTRAADAYLQLLATLDDDPPAEVAALVRAHLVPLSFVLPPDLLRQTGLDALERGDRGRALPRGTGARLAAWWRSRDAAPATRHNERLEEHLRRVAHAEAAYRSDDGFDDRARVYVRLGPPTRTTTVPFDNMNFRNKVVDRSLTLHLSDFPANEFWFYEHIDDAAQFLFYDAGGHFRLGEVQDLVPSVLTTGLGPSERGQHKARALVRTLDEIYRQLSLHHPGFTTRYQEVAEFSGMIDEAEFVAESARQFQPNRQAINPQEDNEALPQEVRDALASSTGPTTGSAGLPGSIFSPDKPEQFAQSFMMRAHAEEEQDRLRREEVVPRTYTNTFDAVEPLPVVVRAARFLDDDGTTRTEVYWGAPPGALTLSKQTLKTLGEAGIVPDDYLLVGTVVQQTEDFRDQVVNYQRHLLSALADADDAALQPQTYAVRGDTGTYHLALQWDQYLATLDGDDHLADLGQRLKAASYRIDTLQALRRDEAVLEMSDLKPMTVLDRDRAARPDDLLDAATLYPFTALSFETPLLLYFEVYHLAFDPEDRTQYTIAYEVRSTEKGGLLRFLGGAGDKGTAAQTDYTGTSRTAREYILLDLSQWEGSGTLEITVRLTDEVTGRRVERSLDFTLTKKN